MKGETVTANRIRVSKSVVGEAEKLALAEVVDDGYLGMGVWVQRFEQALSEFFGGRAVACVNTGTAALHLAFLAIGLKPGDEVLVQSLTYLATFQAISATGATPVPCEIDPNTITIDLKDAERRLTDRTRAIVPVHYASGVGPLDDIYAFAQRHSLRVVEDAAHAFGTVYKGRDVGTFGDISCFSFDGIKNITSGEGGAVVSNDAELMEHVRDARLLGVIRDTEQRYKSERSWDFDVTSQGFRYHMSNLFAAIGLVQLGRFPDFRARRVALARRYAQALSGHSGFAMLDLNYEEVVPHIFPVRVLHGRRDALRQSLSSQGIESGIHYLPNHLLSYYGDGQPALPVTEQVYGELLTLPLHPEVTDQDQHRILEIVLNA